MTCFKIVTQDIINNSKSLTVIPLPSPLSHVTFKFENYFLIVSNFSFTFFVFQLYFFLASFDFSTVSVKKLTLIFSCRFCIKLYFSQNIVIEYIMKPEYHILLKIQIYFVVKLYEAYASIIMESEMVLKKAHKES